MAKWRIFLLFLCSLVMLLGCKKVAPDAVDLTDNPVYFADYHGKWIVLNYWASWCKPCLTELPQLDALAARSAQKIVVLAINYDGIPNSETQPYIQKLPHIRFLKSFALKGFHIADVPTLPTTFIFSQDGKLLTTLNGPQTAASILAAIQPHAGASAP